MAQRGASGLGGEGLSGKQPASPRAIDLPDHEAELRAALSRRALLLRYQPIIRLRNGHIAALEGLVRWPSPDGLMQAGAFVPLAEKLGLALDLTMRCWNASRMIGNRRPRPRAGLR